MKRNTPVWETRRPLTPEALPPGLSFLGRERALHEPLAVCQLGIMQALALPRTVNFQRGALPAGNSRRPFTGCTPRCAYALPRPRQLPSSAPSTAARSHPARPLRCFSSIITAYVKDSS